MPEVQPGRQRDRPLGHRALVKRMLKGRYASVEPFHLFRYLDEQVLRFNTRKQTDAERFKAMTAAWSESG